VIGGLRIEMNYLRKLGIAQIKNVRFVVRNVPEFGGSLEKGSG